MEAGRCWLPPQGLVPRLPGVGVEVVGSVVEEEEVVNLLGWAERVVELCGLGFFLGWVEYLEVERGGFFGVKH